MRRTAQHGTRSKYAAGCHCQPCTEANRIYARQLARHHRRTSYGLEHRTPTVIDATETRHHLTWLLNQGIGIRSIANHLGLSRSAIQRIHNGTRTHIRPATANRILAMGRHRIPAAQPARALIDATTTLNQIRHLLELGHRPAHLAKALGYQTRALQLPTNGLITRARAERINTLHQQLTNRKATNA